MGARVKGGKASAHADGSFFRAWAKTSLFIIPKTALFSSFYFSGIFGPLPLTINQGWFEVREAHREG
jgi:hypothetical protein